MSNYEEFGDQSFHEPLGNSGVSGTHTFRGFFRGKRLAGGLQRAGSGLIDWAPAWILYHQVPVIGKILCAAWIFWNICWMQAKTSQSIGKLVMGTRLVIPWLNPNNSNAYWGTPSLYICTIRATVNTLLVLWGWPFLIACWIRLCFNVRQEGWADSMSNTLVLYEAGDIELSDFKGARDR